MAESLDDPDPIYQILGDLEELAREEELLSRQIDVLAAVTQEALHKKLPVLPKPEAAQPSPQLAPASAPYGTQQGQPVSGPSGSELMRRILLQSIPEYSGLETPIAAPSPGFYSSMAVAPALGVAQNPSAEFYPVTNATVLALQPNNGSENYLLRKALDSPAQEGLLPITVEDAKAQTSGAASGESAASPAMGPAMLLNSTEAAAATTASIVSTAFSSVSESTLSSVLQQCLYSALPWGQCGGISACPSFLNGTCTDQAWATVCCPPSNGYQQSCSRVYSYYWQCLPSSQLPTNSSSGLVITGSEPVNVSYPHVGPNPDLTLVIAAPQVSPPPPVTSLPPPAAASPPPPLQQTVVFSPPPAEDAGSSMQGKKRMLSEADQKLTSKQSSWSARSLLASIQNIISSQPKPVYKSPPPPPPVKRSPPPPMRNPPALVRYPPPAAKSPPPRVQPAPISRAFPPPPLTNTPPPPVLTPKPPPAAATPGLLWADEFTGSPSASGLDNTSWSFQLGDGSAWGIPGWGNNELEIYSDDNVLVSGGALSITATFDGVNFQSGRIRTFGKRDFVPSKDAPNGIRVEASIQMPIGGQGIWPAFWMLPSDSPAQCSGCGVYGSWPASGEIDIMEAVNDMNTAFATLHYGGPSSRQFSSYWTHGAPDARITPLTKGFHTFAVDWSAQRMVFSVDNSPYLTINCACAGSSVGFCGSTNGWFTTNSGGSQTWGNCAPFDRPFHIILNLAVGGGWPGNPTPSTQFPQSMQVDYVRVYRI